MDHEGRWMLHTIQRPSLVQDPPLISGILCDLARPLTGCMRADIGGSAWS